MLEGLQSMGQQVEHYWVTKPPVLQMTPPILHMKKNLLEISESPKATNGDVV